jgi:hypothetical protein
MAKWWIGVALVSFALAFPGAALAQFPPFDGGPPPMPEPLPVSGTGPPGCAPNAGGPPPLTEKTLTIGGDRSNAWGCEETYDNGPLQNFGQGCACYLAIGSTAYRRQSLGSRPLAVLDPQNIDTGNPPPPGQPVIENTSTVAPPLDWGPKVTVGYRWDGGSVELTGFYLSERSASHTIARPGRIDLPFFNPPLGFEGDNGLWLQADRNTITHESALGNAELNYRCAPICGYGLEILAGVRYLDLKERFKVFTDDDGLTVFPPDPFRMATYSLQTHNRILAGQLGFDWEHPLWRMIGFGFFAKGAWGENFIKQEVTLIRGDGFRAAPGQFSKTTFGSIYETGVYLDVFLCDRVRLRGGYNAMWVVNVADAAENVDFNLRDRAGIPDHSGSIFYHGPSIELHILF